MSYPISARDYLTEFNRHRDEDAEKNRTLTLLTFTPGDPSFVLRLKVERTLGGPNHGK